MKRQNELEQALKAHYRVED